MPLASVGGCKDWLQVTVTPSWHVFDNTDPALPSLGRISCMMGHSLQMTCAIKGHKRCRIVLRIVPQAYYEVEAAMVRWLVAGIGATTKETHEALSKPLREKYAKAKAA